MWSSVKQVRTSISWTVRDRAVSVPAAEGEEVVEDGGELGRRRGGRDLAGEVAAFRDFGLEGRPWRFEAVDIGGGGGVRREEIVRATSLSWGF